MQAELTHINVKLECLWNTHGVILDLYFTLTPANHELSKAVLSLYYTPIIFWLPVMGCTKAGLCDVRRAAWIIGALPRETAGLFQEVTLVSRKKPWVFHERSNLTFICVRSACIYYAAE